MTDITVKIRDKIATAEGSPVIVCGNDDYRVIFDLDSEWDEIEIKTMRIAWTDTFSGQPRHTDIPFILNFAALPVIADAYEIGIGIYAGNLKTTTPARVPCERCITDGGTYHEDPEPDTYAALLALLSEVAHAGGAVGDCVFSLEGVNAGTAGQASETTEVE